MSFVNNSLLPGHVALYEISSELGVIDPAGWSPFSGADSTWRVLGTPTVNELTEIKETGALQVNQAAPVSLGLSYDPDPAKLAAGFGVDVEDVKVQIYDPVLDVLSTPEVVYIGEKIYNSLVVNIDALTGEATIENESPFSVGLTGYTIGSQAGELNPSWPGLRAADPGNWSQAGLSSTQFTSELNQNGQTAALLLSAGASVSLGALYTGNGDSQDLTFDFILQDDEFSTSSVVKYSNVGFAGDADNDGDVDGADFLLLQRIAAHQIPVWQLGYDSGASSVAQTSIVPEPTTLLLSMFSIVLVSVRRRIAFKR